MLIFYLVDKEMKSENFPICFTTFKLSFGGGTPDAP